MLDLGGFMLELGGFMLDLGGFMLDIYFLENTNRSLMIYISVTAD